MKIVHVITRLIVGGAQENTLLSCEGQHDAGHEVTLITGPPLGPEGSLMERAKAYGYRVEVLQPMRRSILPGKDVGVYRALVRRFGEMKPDVVHTHSSKAGIIGRYAAWKAKVPLVVHTIHGLSWTSSTRPYVNGIYKSLERLAARKCHKIVVVADAMTRESLAAGLGRPEQYVTVYSGMETGPFLNPPVSRGEMRRRLGLEERHVAVCTIARLFYLKGHEDFLDHAPRLCRENAELRFVWVGDGLLRPEFERRIRQMGLEDRFILTGLVPPERVPELVNACDILAHPSRREGLARALPQGSLAGLPVVTYDVDGNAEALVEGETGYAVKAFDVAAFIGRIEELAREPERRRRFGERGRAFALGRFDARVMIDRLEEVYGEGVGQNGDRKGAKTQRESKEHL
jgi:glycosyltransferase involved in cell wall biosynthesis